MNNQEKPTREELKSEILRYLGLKKQAHLYEITEHIKDKIAGLQNSAISRAWYELIREGSLSPILKDSKTLRNRKKSTRTDYRKPYELTMYGFLKAVIYESSFEKLDLIVGNNASKLPLLLQEWNYFKENYADERIVEALRVFYTSYVMEDKFEGTALRSKRKIGRPSTRIDEIESFLRELRLSKPKLNDEILTRHVFFFNLPVLIMRLETDTFIPRKFLKEIREISFDWVKLWSRKKELRYYMNMQLSQIYEDYARKLSYVDEIRKYASKCNSKAK